MKTIKLTGPGGTAFEVHAYRAGESVRVFKGATGVFGAERGSKSAGLVYVTSTNGGGGALHAIDHDVDNPQIWDWIAEWMQKGFNAQAQVDTEAETRAQEETKSEETLRAELLAIIGDPVTTGTACEMCGNVRLIRSFPVNPSNPDAGNSLLCYQCYSKERRAHFGETWEQIDPAWNTAKLYSVPELKPEQRQRLQAKVATVRGQPVYLTAQELTLIVDGLKCSKEYAQRDTVKAIDSLLASFQSGRGA